MRPTLKPRFSSGKKEFRKPRRGRRQRRVEPRHRVERPSAARLVTGKPGSPHGTIPPKCDRSGATFTAKPCSVIQRRTRTPIAPIFASRPPAMVQMPTRPATLNASTPIARARRSPNPPARGHSIGRRARAVRDRALDTRRAGPGRDRCADRRGPSPPRESARRSGPRPPRWCQRYKRAGVPAARQVRAPYPRRPTSRATPCRRAHRHRGQDRGSRAIRRRGGGFRTKGFRTWGNRSSPATCLLRRSLASDATQAVVSRMRVR